MFPRGIFSRAARECVWTISHRGPIASERSFADSKLLPLPELDIEYLVNPDNHNSIKINAKKRKTPEKLSRVVDLYEKFKLETDPSKKDTLWESVTTEASALPNFTHPDVHPTEPKTIKSCGFLKQSFRPKTFNRLVENLRLFRMEDLTVLTGRRSYFFIGDLAELEHALIRYTISYLLKRNFKLIGVPDILPGEIIERCGMATKTERTQVFKFDDAHGENMYLSGTAEMGLAACFANTVMNEKDLPLCLASVSRCHRAELSTVIEEQGLYRVHHFTKVEMFGYSHPDHSEELFQRFVDIQFDLFNSLGLEFAVLDMPMSDLGLPAYRKFDIEAWFPGQRRHGEVSSCSNCTDYQARRLNMKFRDANGSTRHLHTVNGTACAIPRMVMAIFETHQLENGNISIPEPLRVYFDGRDEIRRKEIPTDGKLDAGAA